jgi:hypothetical protein
MDLPEGLHRVLAVEAAIRNVTIEGACIENLTEAIETHFELPEFYNTELQAIYKARGRRKRKAATN